MYILSELKGSLVESRHALYGPSHQKGCLAISTATAELLLEREVVLLEQKVTTHVCTPQRMKMPSLRHSDACLATQQTQL